MVTFGLIISCHDETWCSGESGHIMLPILTSIFTLIFSYFHQANVVSYVTELPIVIVWLEHTVSKTNTAIDNF